MSQPPTHTHLQSVLTHSNSIKSSPQANCVDLYHYYTTYTIIVVVGVGSFSDSIKSNDFSPQLLLHCVRRRCRRHCLWTTDHWPHYCVPKGWGPRQDRQLHCVSIAVGKTKQRLEINLFFAHSPHKNTAQLHRVCHSTH